MPAAESKTKSNEAKTTSEDEEFVERNAPGCCSPIVNLITCWRCCGLCNRCCPPTDPDRNLGLIPIERRKCTDMFMCIVYVVFMLGMLVIGAFSLSIGNPERLVYATDYQGNVCGAVNANGPDYTTKKRAVYPRINQDMLANAQIKDPRQYKFYAICIEACPPGLTSVCNYDVEAKYTKAQKDACLSDLSLSTSVCNEVRANCWTIPIQQTEILFRCLPLTNLTSGETTKCLFPKGIPNAADPRCVLAEDDKATLVQRPAQKNYLFDQLSAAASLWGRYFADLVQASWVIALCAIVLPIVLSFGFIKFLQTCTGIVVWTIVYLTMAVSIAATVIAYLKAGLINPSQFTSYAEQFAIANGTVAALDSAISGSVLDASAANSDTWRYVAYVMTAITILLLVVLIAVRKQIAQSIDIITLGADAINAMPLMVFFPLLTVATLVAFLFWWIYVAANLMSAGTAEEIDSAAAVTAANIRDEYGSNVDVAAVTAAFGNSTSFTTYSVSDVFFYLQIYHVFGLLWTNQFIQAISVLSISGAVSAYYFSLDGREKHPEYGAAIKQWKIDNKWRKAAKTKEEEEEEKAEAESGAAVASTAASADKPASTDDVVLLNEADIPTDADVPAGLDGHKIPRLRLFRKTGHRGSYEVIAALWRTIRKHMGTAAFGALLIAIVQMLRVVMAYFDKQLDQLVKSGHAWVAYIKWYINFCLWCLEQCVKFVTRNSFVYTALKGQAFCAAARSVFGLILRKAALLVFVNAVTNVIIFLGQLSIAVLCAIVCWGLLENLPMFQDGGSSAVFSSWLPTVIVVLFAYFVAAFFFNTFDVAVDTMLIAYVTDMEECKIKNGIEFPLHYKAPKQAAACCCGICGCCGCCAGSAKNADAALTDAREHYAKGKTAKVPGETPTGGESDAKATDNPAAAGKADFVAALHAWGDGRLRESAAILEGWLLEQPHDVLAVRILHDTYYALGDSEQLRDSPGRVLGAWDAHRPGYLKVCGMLAFGAQECRQMALAEEQGMRALSDDMEDAWALHAVTHVYESQGRRYEGQRLLRTARWFWDKAELLQVHLHWHWALMQLGDGQYERAMGRYDEWVREDGADQLSCLSDAASLLWRMELLGIDVFDRWVELVPLMQRFAGVHATPFTDIHMAMVYAGAGEESMLQEHLESMRRDALENPLFEPAMESSVDCPPASDPAAMAALDPLWTVPRRGPHQRPEPGGSGERAEGNAAAGADSAAAGDGAAGEAAARAGGAAADEAAAAVAVRSPAAAASPLPMARASEAALDPPSFAGSAYSRNAPEGSRKKVAIRPVEEFMVAEMPDAESLDPDDPARPILPCPMSTLPVLPLRVDVPDFGAIEDGTLPAEAANDPGSLPTRSELVSLGGVGGLGLGSHSILDNRYAAATVGVAIAEGMAAYRMGRSDEAVAKLLPLRSSMHVLGGSRVGRDVFARTLEAAATQSRQLLLARALLRERATNSPNDGQTMFHLSSVLFGTGDYRQAAQSRDRALSFGLGQARHMARQRHPDGAMPKNLEPFRVG